MKVISIVNIKGGVGKTVSSVNIAACLGEMNKRTLIVDADAQSNATQYVAEYDPKGMSTYDVFMDKNLDIKGVIRETGLSKVHIIPGNIKLALCENEILSDTKRSRETRLQRALDKVSSEYDFVIIDCPPSLGIITTNALVASDYVLVPVKIDRFALDGLEYLLDTMNEIKDEFNSSLEFLGAFITMDKRTAINRDVKVELSEALGEKLLKTAIRDNVRLVQSTFEQKPVILYDKNASSSKDYKALTGEVLRYVE